MIQRSVGGAGIGFDMESLATGQGVPGAAVTVRRSIDGGADAAGTGAVSDLGGGHYTYVTSAGDVNGGSVTFFFTASGCKPVERTVFPFDPASYPSVLVGPAGAPGAGGITPQLRESAGYIQVSYDTGGSWSNLLPLSDITGPAGPGAMIGGALSGSSGAGVLYVDAGGDMQELSGTSGQVMTFGTGGVPQAVSLSGVLSITAAGVTSLTASGVIPGTYGAALLVPKITVDASGRITSVMATAVASTDGLIGITAPPAAGALLVGQAGGASPSWQPSHGMGAFAADGTLTVYAFAAAGTSHAAGAVPDPGSTAHTDPPWYLGDDAAWHVPLGGLVSQNYTTGTYTTTAASWSAPGTSIALSITPTRSGTLLLELTACLTNATVPSVDGAAIYVGGALIAYSAPAINVASQPTFIRVAVPQVVSAGTTYTVDDRYYCGSGSLAVTWRMLRATWLA